MPGSPAEEHEPAGGPVSDVVPREALDFPAVVGTGVVERDDDIAAGDPLGDAVLGEAAEFEIEAGDIVIKQGLKGGASFLVLNGRVDISAEPAGKIGSVKPFKNAE